MSLIQLEIDDTLIQAIGLQAVKTLRERTMFFIPSPNGIVVRLIKK